jgi:hypothetical protein
MIVHEASFGVCFSCVTSFLMAHNGQPRRDFQPGFFYAKKILENPKKVLDIGIYLWYNP